MSGGVRAPSSRDICLFGGFRLDRRRGILFRRDERGVFVPLALGSLALVILRTITPAAMEAGTRYRNPELRELFLSGLRMAVGERV